MDKETHTFRLPIRSGLGRHLMRITVAVRGDRLLRVHRGSTDPSRGARARWKVDSRLVLREHPRFESSLEGLSCVSSNLCVAVDNGGDIVRSTDPRRGQTAKWTAEHVDNVTLQAVSCASPSLCIAVDAHGRAIIGTPAR